MSGTSIKAASNSSRATGREPRGQQGLGQEFTGLLQSTVIESLGNILGKPAMGALVERFQIDRLAESPERFHSALAGVFGNGSVVLEKVIVRDFYKKLGLPSAEGGAGSGFDFAEMISLAMARMGAGAR